jgi:hypothetical protein
LEAEQLLLVAASISSLTSEAVVVKRTRWPGGQPEGQRDVRFPRTGVPQQQDVLAAGESSQRASSNTIVLFTERIARKSKLSRV